LRGASPNYYHLALFLTTAANGLAREIRLAGCKIPPVPVRQWEPLAAILACCLLAAGTAHATPGAWSAPTMLSGCVLASGPQVAFPSESPSVATGPGAIVWAEDPRCGSAAARPAGAAPELSVAAIAAAGAKPARRQPLEGRLQFGLAATGASKGRIAVAAQLRARPGSGRSGAEVLQGRAPGPLSPARTLSAGDGPVSLTRAYLGDAAIAAVQRRPRRAIAVSVERFFRSGFGPVRLLPIPSGRVSALTATMDYRSDVLLAWQQNGAIFAHMLRASGRPEPTQRVGESAPSPRLQALVSDNDHGMIAWSTRAAHGGRSRTQVLLALSGSGVRFDSHRIVASFTDARGIASAPGSLALVRLSSENVMLSWTDSEGGRMVVRAAPAVFAGTAPAARLSDPARQSVLAALAPGPAGEAVALWRSTPPSRSGFDGSHAELWAARAFIERHGRVGFSRAERVTSEAANVAPSLAVDPASDRPVAAWLRLGERPRIEYATGPGASTYRAGSPPGSAAPASGGSDWLSIALVAAAAAAIIATIALVARRRVAGKRAGRASRRRG
jgi:hypothetical protein